MTVMDTRIFNVKNISDDEKALTARLAEAASILASGGTAAFPTETVYGLGANALNESAVGKIYEAKGRPSDNPLIVHIADISQLDDIVSEIPTAAASLMERFWPGPLSIIMKKNKRIPDCVTAGLDTVAVRMPENSEARVLLRLCKCPIAAPSANLSGKPSPTRAEHVIHDLDGRVDAIIAGRDCRVGIESTVIDMSCDPPVILRPGIITREEIEAVTGPVLIAGRKEKTSTVPRAPGMKYTHYAPDAPMLLFEGSEDNMLSQICERAEKELAADRTVGIIATDGSAEIYRQRLAGAEHGRLLVYSAGSRTDLKTVARSIFDILRTLDSEKADIILSESFDPTGIGFSVMNRMDKAASEIV